MAQGKKAEKPSSKQLNEELRKKKDERNLSDIRSVASKPEGRRFIWRILERAGIFQPNGHEEAISMARVEGRRENGIELLTDVMRAKPVLFGQMQQEHASELKREEIEIEIDEKDSDLLSLD